MFGKFQESVLGIVDREAAVMALSGGVVCPSFRQAFIYYFKLTLQAPIRVKPNLVFNCAIMLIKVIVLRREGKKVLQ